MRPLFVLAVLILTACGADGPPLQPGPEPSVSITGEVAVGFSGKIGS